MKPPAAGGVGGVAGEGMSGGGSFTLGASSFSSALKSWVKPPCADGVAGAGFGVLANGLGLGCGAGVENWKLPGGGDCGFREASGSS